MAPSSYENEHPQKAFGWAARDPFGIMSPFNFSRRHITRITHSILTRAILELDPATGEKDVTFKVLYCGICHSDLHFIKNEWGNAKYPAVPGHEIVGEVTQVGSKVQKFKVGDKVGVGCMVGSCRSCENCNKSLENYCPKMIFTYGSTYYDGTITFGGYSNIMVVDEHFAVRIPNNMPLDATAPLLCAGITVYSPLKYFELDKPGLHIGVVGLGGLGHMAVKFAKAFGAEVTVISTSPNKKDEAIKHLGADSFLVSRDPEEMQAATGTMDGIIDTVSAVHPLLPLIDLLKSHGKLVMIVAGSCIGGMKETQEMIDFAAKHGIKSDIEVIPMDYINTAMERMVKADVRYRFKMAKSPENEHPRRAFGWAARDSSGVLSPFNFSRRLKVLLHNAKTMKVLRLHRHEIVGEVTEVGSKVQNFKVGDKVGVGCMVGSCRSCDNCANNMENYCPRMILTYGSTYFDGTTTYGGYSNIMVVDEHFAVRIPDNMPLAATAPLLCAGVTVYSPLKYFELDKPGLHIGVAGLGGLGHVAVKFAKAFGAKVTVISTSPNKKDEAINRLGADSFLVSRDHGQMQAAMGTMDGIIDTVSAVHPLVPLAGLLKSHGKLVMVGRKMLAGSNIGGMKETQEMIDFAAKHGIQADIEVIPIDYVNTAMERLVKADVRYRFVLTKLAPFRLKEELVPCGNLTITEIGSNVQDFEVGDKVGVSGMTGSCDHCSSDLKNFCRRMVPVNGGTYCDGTKTYGGFSDSMVIDEHFAVRIPDNVALDAIAPLLCAGITVYSPMKYFQLDKPGLHIGVVGLGALGHMALNLPRLLGLSNSSKDKDEAINHLGADFFLVFHKPNHTQAAMETMDGIIDAVPVAHCLSPLVDLLKARGKLIMLFCSDAPLELPLSSLTRGSKVIAGNHCIGGIKEMQEMINFAAEHDIEADVEVIPMDYINRAVDRLDKGDVKYRFAPVVPVITVQTITRVTAPKMMASYGATYCDGTKTYGGFSDLMAIDEHSVVRIPDNMAPDATAPPLCAGITVYSPLKYFEPDKPRVHVAVVGLGPMAVKFANAFGLSSPRSKKDDALERFGCNGTMDGIINTVCATPPALPFLNLLKSHAKLIMLGGTNKPLELPVFPLIMSTYL
ncbi:hypothetical protein Cgig2_019564 [Carnegiea gigantea]|uniref:Enoyl reductase (ER) domain-containing protein n=1 Tax=Carnegiea gigantea TaxID=171969 RepID=A0A9Q1KJ05_9CARY|nr:hypothetical protein Cgig2_019564 [Carnegiea gigantea]